METQAPTSTMDGSSVARRGRSEALAVWIYHRSSRPGRHTSELYIRGEEQTQAYHERHSRAVLASVRDQQQLISFPGSSRQRRNTAVCTPDTTPGEGYSGAHPQGRKYGWLPFIRALRRCILRDSYTTANIFRAFAVLLARSKILGCTLHGTIPRFPSE